MDLNTLLTNARQLLKDRTDSLEKDVRYCILRNVGTPDWPAPFPAILYCFSTIDLLGALYGGDASGRKSTSKLALNYMTDVMQYPKDKAKLLQKVFRHKIVHLAQPKPIVKINGKYYSWGYHHNKRGIHLQVRATNQPNLFEFWISIWSLVEDIIGSVFKPNGYLDRLGKEPNLQRNFEIAYKQIFELG